MFVVLFAAPVYAFDGDLYREQYEESGAAELEAALPDETKELMDGIDISPDEAGHDGFSAESFINTLIDITERSARQPLSVCVVIAAIIVICSLADGLKDASRFPAMSGVVQVVSAAAVCCTLLQPLTDHLGQCIELLDGLCGFLTVFAPVYGGILLAVGRTMTAGSFNAGMLGMAAVISSLVKNSLLELMRIFFAIASVAAVAPSIRLDSVIALIEKNAKWGLTLLATVFIGYLGISCTLSSSMDLASVKTARLLLSGSVPIVGGVMGDAVSSVSACVELLRSSVGSFGLVALGFIFIPSIVRTALWRLGLDACEILAGMFELKAIERLLRSMSGALAVLLALLVFIAVISLTMLTLVMGGGRL